MALWTSLGVVRGYCAEMLDFPGLTFFANERWAETNTEQLIEWRSDGRMTRNP